MTSPARVRDPFEFFRRPVTPDVFGRISLVRDDEPESDASAADETPRDRRDIVIRVPGSQSIVMPYVEPVDERAAELQAITDRSTIDVQTPPAYTSLYDPPLGSVRFRVFWGGRGAARSWQVARALLVHGRTRRHRFLCAREWQNSIKDSVHKVLSDQIRLLGLGGFYSVTKDAIVGENGTEFLFKGLRRDIGSVKSTEGITICWVEEAQSVSANSWRELEPTIRADGSEIWVTFNTGDEDDATYLRLVAPTLKEHKRYDPKFPGIVKKTSYRDNPWLPKVLRDDEQRSRRTDPEEHAHVWDGEFWRRSKAQVLNGKWRVDEFEPVEGSDEWGYPYFGVDWGFSANPLIIVKLWVRANRLWVEYTEGGLGIDEHDDIADVFDRVPGSRDYTLRADNARPEIISAMRKRHFNVVPDPKGKGSIKQGVAHLRSYEEIIIHPRCTYAISHARLWRHKTRPGASGDPHADDAEVLPALVDGNDDTWDASRYALRPRMITLSRAAPPSVSEEIA